MLTHANAPARDPASSSDPVGARIVAGVDGSSESLVAARQAAILLAQNGSLELVAAVPPAASAMPAFGTVAVLHELESGAEQALREARERWPQAATTLTFGTAPEVLLDAAARGRATLLAVGSHGRRRLPGIVLGRVTTHLLHRAPCSVLVARERDAGIAFPRTIVVGTDGSTHGNDAVRVALELGSRFDAPVRAVVATGTEPVDSDHVPGVQEIEWSDRPPVDALVAAAAGADLVVLGSRGLRGPRALGSVSERVAHAAPCSVLVVRSA